MTHVKKTPNALKHGGYSSLGLLDGEDPKELEKLRKGLFEDFYPSGAMQRSIVEDIVRQVWRLQNLSTFWEAERARMRYRDIKEQHRTDPLSQAAMNFSGLTSAQQEAARNQAMDELGESFELVDEPAATAEQLTRELDLEERLKAALDKSLKRLTQIRGMVSIGTFTPLSDSPDLVPV